MTKMVSGDPLHFSSRVCVEGGEEAEKKPVGQRGRAP